MALHHDLPIYRTGVQLTALAFKAQEQMPRNAKRNMGEKINQYSVDMLELMALANATQHRERAGYIEQLLTRHRAMTVLMRVSLERRYISIGIWSESVQLLDSIGKQGGGWLKSAANKRPAA